MVKWLFFDVGNLQADAVAHSVDQFTEALDQLT